MQLEFICDMGLAYREDPLTGAKFQLVRPMAARRVQDMEKAMEK